MEIAIGIPGYSCPNLIRMTSPLTLTQGPVLLEGGRLVVASLYWLAGLVVASV